MPFKTEKGLRPTLAGGRVGTRRPPGKPRARSWGGRSGGCRTTKLTTLRGKQRRIGRGWRQTLAGHGPEGTPGLRRAPGRRRDGAAWHPSTGRHRTRWRPWCRKRSWTGWPLRSRACRPRSVGAVKLRFRQGCTARQIAGELGTKESTAISITTGRDHLPEPNEAPGTSLSGHWC